MAKVHDVLTGQALGSVVNVLTLTAASCALAAGIVLAVWNVLDDRADIGAPDEPTTVRYEPSPATASWRSRIPDSVGTTTFTSNNVSLCPATATPVSPDGSTAYTCSTVQAPR